jgi:hypothetical protein
MEFLLNIKNNACTVLHHTIYCKMSFDEINILNSSSSLSTRLLVYMSISLLSSAFVCAPTACLLVSQSFCASLCFLSATHLSANLSVSYNVSKPFITPPACL